MEEKKIEISAKSISFEAVRYGAMVRVIQDWAEESHLEKNEDASIILASLILLSGCLPDDSGVSNEDLSALVLDLYSNRGIEIEDGPSFKFPTWEVDIPPFHKQLCAFGMFTVHSCLGFRYGYDAIVESKLIYPYRSLILLAVLEGFANETEEAKYEYVKMKEYLAADDTTALFYKAVINAVKE